VERRIGALPIYTAAAKDPMYADPRYKGWFEELAILTIRR